MTSRTVKQLFRQNMRVLLRRSWSSRLVICSLFNRAAFSRVAEDGDAEAGEEGEEEEEEEEVDDDDEDEDEDEEEESAGAASNILPVSSERPRTIGLTKPCLSQGACSESSCGARARAPPDLTSDDSSMADNGDCADGRDGPVPCRRRRRRCTPSSRRGYCTLGATPSSALREGWLSPG